MKKILLMTILFILTNAFADKDIHDSVLAVKAGDKILKFSGYFDTYYSYDFSKPLHGEKDLKQGGGREFTSNPLYDRQFSVGYAFLQSDFEADDASFRFAYHTGDIVHRMYEAESESIKPIREASGKLKFSEQTSLEAGIMPSIFGFETFINKENMHATRAHMTDFAPDFDAGIRLYHHLGANHHLKFQITNGWQVIRDTNTEKALGAAYVYEEKNKLIFNWGQFFGNEAPERNHHQYRYYNNIFAKIYKDRFIYAPMFDIGWGEKYRSGKSGHYWAPWHSAGFSIRYALTEKQGIAGRITRIQDPNNIIPELKTSTPNGWISINYTITYEYLFSSNVTIRGEGYFEKTKDGVHKNKHGHHQKEDSYLYSSIAFNF